MWQVVRDVRNAISRREGTASSPRPLATSTPTPPPSAEAGQVFLLLPDEFTEEEAAPRPAKAGRRGGQATRLAAYGAAGLLAGAGLLRLGAAPALPAPHVSPAEPGAVTPQTLQGRVDRAADLLLQATGALDLRVRLFQSRQMQCPDLARGLVLVEERWAEYNAAQAANGVPHDSVHVTLDRSLYAGVDAAERQFEQSNCPRP